MRTWLTKSNNKQGCTAQRNFFAYKVIKAHARSNYISAKICWYVIEARKFIKCIYLFLFNKSHFEITFFFKGLRECSHFKEVTISLNSFSLNQICLRDLSEFFTCITGNQYLFDFSIHW